MEEDEEVEIKMILKKLDICTFVYLYLPFPQKSE